ncbi:MAG: LysR family transcriptional regulator [Paludibacteraceae bacterium]|nr:LysR family transcriptional regulator [Paludibacteraceae bacterium]
MELRQLKAFVKAAELLNFSEAARALCVNQSSFSQYIKQLEEELNVTLFHRNTHEISLTQAGVELLPHAQKTLQNADNCISHMNDLLEMRCGTLNIGVTHSFSLVLTETLETFCKEYPGIKVNIYYKTMSDLMQMLIKRDVDFVLSYRPSLADYPQVQSRTLFEDHLSVIVPKTHTLAKKKHITLQELSAYPLAMPAKGLRARKVLDTLLAGRDIQLDVRTELNLVSPLLRLVKKGMFLTVLSGSAVDAEQDLVAIPIDEEGSRMEGSCQMLKEDYRKEAAKEFVKILSEKVIIKNKLDDWFK